MAHEAMPPKISNDPRRDSDVNADIAEGARMAPNPGTPDGMTVEDVEMRAELAAALGKEVWPADRDGLLRALDDRHNYDDRVHDAIRRLPAGQRFDNVQAVARALGIGTERHRD